MAANPQGPPQVGIPVGGIGGVGGVGSFSITPPTFHYLHHMSMPPTQTGTAQDYKSLLELHKTASDQFRDSLTFIFDLMVTKTILPLVTLLLGYLFGSKKN